MIGVVRQRRIENTIYATLWLIVFCVPFIDYFVTDGAKFIWKDCYRTWVALGPFFLIFIINNFIAIPNLFNKKKYWKYITLVLVSIILIFTLYPRFFQKKQMHIDDRPPMPMEQMAKDPGARHDFNPELDGRGPGMASPVDNIGKRDIMKRPRPLIGPWTRDFVFINIIIAILLVGFNIGINLFFRSISDQQALKELEKSNLQFELDYLKGQINPHFLMNMLNNIHALVDIDAEKAKETIIGFSKLMRYVLYDGSQKTIGLEKEVDFIRNYVQLMSIRYPQDVDIKLSLPKIVPDIQIPPMLFVSFIENSFKHGISYRNKSFVYISLTLDENKLYYIVRNSVWSNQDEQISSGGIGLTNTKKRLDLIYGYSYKLITEKTDKEYLVNLIIPLIC
jgi:hypothetical protein